MKIAVCMKQVPVYSDGCMDPQTGLILRDQQQAAVNPYDLPALETALRIKEKTGAEVTVFTMGPARAAELLREAYAMGADQGILVNDRAFGGADVLATSFTLSQAIRSQGGYELILCGRQTTDGDTAQVSGAMAQWLELPHFMDVTAIRQVESRGITFQQRLAAQLLQWHCAFPCLLAVDRHIFPPRLPSLKGKIASRRREIHCLGLQELPVQDAGRYGSRGSATRVERIFPPQRGTRVPLRSLDGRAAAACIWEELQPWLGRGGAG